MFNFFSKIRNKQLNKFCKMSDLNVFIAPNGDVHFCPLCMIKDKTSAILGNLHKKSVNKLWSGKEAGRIRKVINNNASLYCYIQPCANRTNFYMQVMVDYLKKYPSEKVNEMPKIVTFGEDIKNIENCIMTDKDVNEIDTSLKNKYYEALKEAKYVVFSHRTDPFSNETTYNFIKELAQKRSDLKFNIVSNGILFNKDNCDDLNITDKLANVLIYVSAAKKETYDKYISNGDFDVLRQNLYWLKSLKEEGKLSNIFLAFTTDENNFREMPEFVEFAKEFNAFALFWLKVKEDYNPTLYSNFDNIANPISNDYEEFIKILSENNLNTDNSCLAYAFNIKDPKNQSNYSI